MPRDDELHELRQRTELAQRMGGPEKLQRHRDNGRMPVRERIDALVDAGSFVEVGALAGSGRYDDSGKLIDFTPSNLVFGRARIEQRPAVVVGDDFTVRGGASDGAVGDKMIVAEKMAHDLRVPIVRLVDGTGGGGSVKTIEQKGYTLLPKVRVWPDVTRCLATVPVVGLGLGSVAGLGAARLAASHYSVMVKDTSQVFVAGPPVVERTGQKIGKNELGGSQIHTRNGVVDDEALSEPDAFERVRRFLSYLPPSVYELPPRAQAHRDSAADQATLRSVIPENPRAVYKIRGIVETLVDAGSFFEIGRHWGKASATGLARIDGWPVMVVASDPYHYGGAWDRQTSEKINRMVDLAQLFHLPVLHLVDIPGLSHRAGRRGRGRDARRRARADRGVADHDPVVHGDRAQGVRRGRRGAPAPRPLQLSLRVAERGVGLAADRRRPRGGLQGRHRGRSRPRGRAHANRATRARVVLAVSQRRGIRRRRHHRPRRHACAPGRVRQPRGAVA